MTERKISTKRKTKETDITLTLNLDSSGEINISTGIGFFDHMLTTLAFHAGWSLNLIAKGDLDVDDHHTVEDCAIVLGKAIDEILQERNNINRFGYAYAPLDESLSRVVVDFVTRPFSILEIPLTREKIGELSSENVTHFFNTLAINGRFTLHLDLIRSSNDHHAVESVFKAFALAAKAALQRTISDTNVSSTKGVL